MRKRFTLNLAILIFANLLVKPVWIFGIDRTVQNSVGAAEYGTYFAVFNFTFIFSILLDFGINNFNNRAVSRHPRRLAEWLPNLMVLKMFLSAAYFLITFCCALIAGYDATQQHLLVLLAVNQIVLQLLLYFRSNLAALQLFKTDTVISVTDKLLAIFFCLYLLYCHAGGITIFSFIEAQTLALLATSVIASAIVFSKRKPLLKFWRLRFARKVLLQSAGFALLALLMSIYYRIDAVMIERLLADGREQAGIYAASFRILDAVNMVAFLFSTLLLPLFSSMLHKRENPTGLVIYSCHLLFVIAVSTATLSFFFSGPIIALLYHQYEFYWSSIFGWLMISFIPISSVYVFGTLLTARGNLKVLNTIALSGALLNIALNLFLIPRYKALGAVWATGITQTVVALLHILAASKEFEWQQLMNASGRYAVFVLVLATACFLLTRTSIDWRIQFILSGIVAITTAFLLRLLSWLSVQSIRHRQ